MVESWVFVIGGIIIGVIAFVTAFNFYMSSINYSENQNMLQRFSELYSNIFSACIQEINSSQEFRITLLADVRVLYATDDKETPPITVVDKIKNKEISSGKNLCMQLENERGLRCLPRESDAICKINIPYLGVLPESEDIWVKVKKILGFQSSRDYSLLIQKFRGKEVNITLVSS